MIKFTKEETKERNRLIDESLQAAKEVRTRYKREVNRDKAYYNINADIEEQLHQLESKAQVRTLEKMNLEEVFEDAVKTIYMWGSFDINNQVKGEVDARIYYHMNKLQDNGSMDKVHELYNLLDQKKAGSLDPELVAKHKNHRLYVGV